MKTLLITSMLGLAGLLTACQTTSVAPQSAVTCDKCRTVYFKAPAGTSPGTKGLVALRDASRMDCPDCENEVLTMLKTGGVTKHVCKSCGGNLRHCSNH